MDGHQQPAVYDNTHSKPCERSYLSENGTRQVELVVGRLLMCVVYKTRGQNECEDHDDKREEEESQQRAPVKVHALDQTPAHAKREAICKFGEGVARTNVAGEGRDRFGEVGGELAGGSL